MKTRHIIITLIAISLLISPCVQAAEKNDSIKAISNCKFNPKQLILPSALIAVGASSLFLSPMKDLDHTINDEMLKLRGEHHSIKLDEYLRITPTVANFALHFAGVESGYNTTDQLLLTATSYGTMFVLTQGLKHTVNKNRPDGSDNHSFPSGHVATAFLGAEQLRMNYGTYWGIAGYTIATGTAFLRLYNNRHWFGDVIGAAGIGILSARIGYWLLPWEKKLLGLNKKDSSTSFIAIPTIDTHSNRYGIALALQF